MDKSELIEQFSLHRPEAVGVYGYGSGVFRQETQGNSKSLTDVIFVVDNIREWHNENILANPKDYSFIGKIHLSRENISKLKGKNNINYLSRIEDMGYSFKYGVMELEDFLRNLEKWDNFFIAGRFQKPVLEIKSNRGIKDVISYNRKCAFMLACLFSPVVTNVHDLYKTLCSFSYMGDARMKFAENPNKVKNIVNGSFDEFSKLYSLNQDYLLNCADGSIIIRYDVILSKLYELPDALLAYMKKSGTDFDDLSSVRRSIAQYLYSRNRQESSAQIIEGFKSNGIFRSVPYALAKVKKRILYR